MRNRRGSPTLSTQPRPWDSAPSATCPLFLPSRPPLVLASILWGSSLGTLLVWVGREGPPRTAAGLCLPGTQTGRHGPSHQSPRWGCSAPPARPGSRPQPSPCMWLTAGQRPQKARLPAQVSRSAISREMVPHRPHLCYQKLSSQGAPAPASCCGHRAGVTGVL